MKVIKYPTKDQWTELLKRPALNTESLFDTVRSIIDKVRAEGDKAVPVGGSILLRMPSNPAAKHPAKTKYGLQEPSGLLSATRGPISPVLVIRISGVRFLRDHVILTGALYPGTKRL